MKTNDIYLHMLKQDMRVHQPSDIDLAASTLLQYNLTTICHLLPSCFFFVFFLAFSEIDFFYFFYLFLSFFFIYFFLSFLFQNIYNIFFLRRQQCRYIQTMKLCNKKSRLTIDEFSIFVSIPPLPASLLLLLILVIIIKQTLVKLFLLLLDLNYK